jgi:hypothetical protein
MFKFAAVALLLSAVGLAGAEEYVAKHARPSRLLAMLVSVVPMQRGDVGTVKIYKAVGGNSLIPKGVTIEANDDTGKVKLEGPNEGIAETLKALEMFDVAPIRVRVKVEIVCRADKYSSSSTLELCNNVTGKLSDGVLSLGIELTPRVNADGTVTLAVGAGREASQFTTVGRVAKNQFLGISLLDRESSITFDRHAIGYPTEKQWADQIAANPERIHLRFTAEPVPNSK